MKPYEIRTLVYLKDDEAVFHASKRVGEVLSLLGTVETLDVFDVQGGHLVNLQEAKRKAEVRRLEMERRHTSSIHPIDQG